MNLYVSILWATFTIGVVLCVEIKRSYMFCDQGKIQTAVFRSLLVRNNRECARECARQTNCEAYNIMSSDFGPSLYQCELLVHGGYLPYCTTQQNSKGYKVCQIPMHLSRCI